VNPQCWQTRAWTIFVLLCVLLLTEAVTHFEKECARSVQRGMRVANQYAEPIIKLASAAMAAMMMRNVLTLVSMIESPVAQVEPRSSLKWKNLWQALCA
jgi:hypothetical protein